MSNDDRRRSGGAGGRLDAFGDREVVYCHQCHAEWYNDEHGLVCPTCEGEITEIVTLESDPRPPPVPQNHPRNDPSFERLRHHNPWDATDSDPDEADIEEHVSDVRGGSDSGIRTLHFTRTYRNSSPRQGQDEHNPDVVLSDFHTMLRGLMGPNFRAGQAGRSGQEELFATGPFAGGSGRFENLGSRTQGGVHVTGGQWTFQSNIPLGGARVGERAAGGPPEDPLSAILGNLFGGMQPQNPHDNDHPLPGQRGPGGPGIPGGLQGLLAQLLNPAHMRHGDAVYSQEALDEIISTLMEQQPQSNAPGPAPPDAIAALPKMNLDEKMLGPEGNGECSVCMDDVHVGDEVVCLPCSHWFHEICAGAWLGEHNTCPICRKGIDGAAAPSSRPSNSRRESEGDSRFPPSRGFRMSGRDSERLSRSNTTGNRNEARLDAIRNTGRLTPTHEDLSAAPAPRRYQVVGDRHAYTTRGSDIQPPLGTRRVSQQMLPTFRPRTNSYASSRVEEISRQTIRDEQRASRRRSSTSSPRNETSSSTSRPLSWLRARWGDRSSGSGSGSGSVDRR